MQTHLPEDFDFLKAFDDANELDSLLANYRDPLTPDELIQFLTLLAKRILITHRASQYTASNLQSLVRQGQKSLAFVIARLWGRASDQCQGLLSIHEALVARNEADLGVLVEAYQRAVDIPDLARRLLILLNLARAFVLLSETKSAEAVLDLIKK